MVRGSAVHKRRPQSGGKGSFQGEHFLDKGKEIPLMRTSIFFGAKKLTIFRNL